MTFQIHRDGSSQPIGLTHITDPWSDGLYYFHTASFLRSGKYTISFIVEGVNAAAIKPLVYAVSVQSKTMRCGASDALERLQAHEWLRSEGRRTMQRRLFLEKRMTMSHSDIDAVRAALVTLFLALPQGCLNLSDNEEDTLPEAGGWSDSLELAWITTLEAASHPTELMECVLLLETSIAKGWYLPTSQTGPLMNALPNPHFAIRCGTLSAVALRIYVLDRVLDYSKVVMEAKRAGTRGGKDKKMEKIEKTAQPRGAGKAKASDMEVEIIEDESMHEGGGRSSRKKARTSYVEMDEVEEEEL